jgi:DUF2934 family protein
MSEKSDRVPRKRQAMVSEAALPLTSGDIAVRAYELFLQRGCTHGHDWEDWLAAERELALFAASAVSPASDRAITLRPRRERRKTTPRRGASK